MKYVAPKTTLANSTEAPFFPNPCGFALWEQTTKPVACHVLTVRQVTCETISQAGPEVMPSVVSPWGDTVWELDVLEAVVEAGSKCFLAFSSGFALLRWLYFVRTGRHEHQLTFLL